MTRNTWKSKNGIHVWFVEILVKIYELRVVCKFQHQNLLLPFRQKKY